MDIIYNKYQTQIEMFDNVMIEASSMIMQLQMLLSNFVIDALALTKEKKIILDVDFPLQRNNTFEMVKSEYIYLNEDIGMPTVKILNEETEVVWTDLTISSQDLLANYIHIHIKTDDIFEDLFIN